jgi:hypothetical protein
MQKSVENVSSNREAELASAMQFLNLALGAGGSYDPTQPDHGRASVKAALVGVIRLLGALFPNKPALPISLNHLLYALHDLDRGKTPPLLERATPSKNPGLFLIVELFRAIPAAAMTCLLKQGVKRDVAAKEVARRLTGMGYRSDSGGRFEASQIAKWREKMMTERAAENRAAAQYQLALEMVKSMEGRAAFDFLMRSMPDLYPPNFPKIPPS